MAYRRLSVPPGTLSTLPLDRRLLSSGAVDDTAERQAPPNSDPVRPEVNFQASGPFPDVYGDSVQVSVGPFGLSITFAITDPQDAARRDIVARVRMSPQMAFVMAQLLRKILKKAKEDGIGYTVPQDVLNSLELEEDL
jgi:hypothetical protein